MGQFSWIYSDINKPVINNRIAKTYLLVPELFQDKYGKYIYEGYYEGNGYFGIYNVYDLIPEWNKKMIPEIIRRMKNGSWYCDTNENDIINFQNYYEGKKISCELRWLGIIMTCYDEDNFSLKYPIKITSKEMEYRKVRPSKSDPNQGW